ncbi:site-specific integrase [Mycolicibacterium porcinum]|uniref:tyrosine-type recombinase/integrase n=1 Tax=Mycolicibacterium porcinum TaxID=39693 RepID=UPI0031F7FCA6
MPRQRMAPGEHGRITEHVEKFKDEAGKNQKRYIASVYVRLHSGRLREREATSYSSGEDARRMLLRRIKTELETTAPAGVISSRTTLSELFEAWVSAKVTEDGIKPQSEAQYRQVWRLHGDAELGALRIAELEGSRANTHIQTLPPRQSELLRTVLSGMYQMAARFDVVRFDPIAATKPAKAEPKPARGLTAIELEQVRQAVKVYAQPHQRGGPPRGVLLPAFVELLAATGARPGEVLAIRWQDVDLLGDPPTVTVNGTVIDHGRVPGKSVHRQDARKGDADPHTVLLPKFGVTVLTELLGRTASTDGPVLATRDGGYVSLSNIRSALRDALPESLRWVTPHSFRRSVATVVRDGMGIEAAQAQLSHTQMATTEQHYAQRRTTGPDARATLDKWAGQTG